MQSIIKYTITLIVLALTMTGLTSHTTEASAPQPIASVEHTEVAEVAEVAEVEDTTDPVAAPASLTWYEAVLQYAGIELPDNVLIGLTNTHNCGAELSTVGLGGCTYPAGQDGTIVILVSPELQYTRVGEHILLHEVGHALGIKEECGAEEFAHQWSDPNYWAYPECAPLPTPSLEVAQATAAPQAPVYIPAENTPATPTTAATQPTAEQPIQPTITPATPQPIIEPAPPAPTVPSIPPLTDACSEFEVRAEDGSCVPSNYWEVPPTAPPVVCKGDCPTGPYVPPEHSEPNPETPIDCATIQPGEAWAGVGQVCNFNPVGH